MIQLLEEQVNSVMHFLYTELYRDCNNSTFVFNYQLLSCYFPMYSLYFAFSLSCQIGNHILEEVLTNLHFA